jgi:molecular chaperone DnaK
MIKDAESHAEEDRRQREVAEARNLAENAAYQAEKQLGEMGDKIESSAKDEIEKAIADVKGVLSADDAEEIKAKTDALQAAFHKVSEQIYQEAAEQQASAQPGADGASTDGATGESEEEVVDAEVVDDERS